jgi:hypothetical protein
VCGGWAIDLFVGEVTREHEDVEIGVVRDDQEAVRSLFAGWGLYKAVSGHWVPWEEGERLELPIHQVLARPPGSDPPGEQWEPRSWELEFFLNEVHDGVWRSRRDPRVMRPLEDVFLRSASGIPIVAPEVQLLYKAKHRRDKDEHDFRTARPLLSARQRAWLKEALEIAHPEDPWLAELG